MDVCLTTIESLTVEFKSDRKRLPDTDFVEAVVCLANAEGGDLWLGVEDDALVVDEERRRTSELPIDSLIALGALRQLKRLSAEELAERIQRDLASAKRTLAALTEAGFVEAHGVTRGRTYMLSAAVYGSVADKAAYTRQAGFTPIQHEQMVLSYVRQHGHIKRAEAMDLCRLSEVQVKNLLKRMCQTGLLMLQGAGPAAHYRIGSSVEVRLDEIG